MKKTPLEVNHDLLRELMATALVRTTLRPLAAQITEETGIPISPSTLSRVGNGQSVDVDTLRALAAYFGLHVGQLFTPSSSETPARRDMEAALMADENLTSGDRDALLYLYRQLARRQKEAPG